MENNPTTQKVRLPNYKNHQIARAKREQNLEKAVMFAKDILAAGVNGKRALVSIMDQYKLSARETRNVLKAAKRKQGHA